MSNLSTSLILLKGILNLVIIKIWTYNLLAVESVLLKRTLSKILSQPFELFNYNYWKHYIPNYGYNRCQEGGLKILSLKLYLLQIQPNLSKVARL